MLNFSIAIQPAFEFAAAPAVHTLWKKHGLFESSAGVAINSNADCLDVEKNLSCSI